MKILKPKNLDLSTLIGDKDSYSYLSNTSGRLSSSVKKGNVFRKLIPEILYFINVCIYKDEAHGDFRTVGFKRIRITDVHHVMSYKKMRQVIHFLVQQKIIEVCGITEFITVNGKEFGINAKYFKLLPPYDGSTEIIEINLKCKRKVSINGKANQLIKTNPSIRHQYEMCSNYDFNADDALIHANNLHNQKAINEKQWASMLDYIEKLRNKSVLFNYNEKTDRIFTIINMCNKELRPYFQIKRGNNYESLIELDFSTFNIQVLHKLIDDSINLININEAILKELDKLAQWLQEDFYKKIQDVGVLVGTLISRDAAKDLAIKHWQNARLDSWNEETKIMKTLFPEITKAMNVLKGKTYADYLKYSNGFMRIESQLVQEIYSAFDAKNPTVCIYNIFDSFMVENQYKDDLRRIMDDCSKRYFKRQVKIKEKVTNIL